jgi:HPt (histidine-containing phosphotransfer) domain-containing protein
MNCPTLPSNSAPRHRRTCEAKWTPPAELLVLATDDEGLIADLIDLFKADVETDIQKLRAALAAGDIPRMRAGAHSIRGSALQVGADFLLDVCHELELASSLTPGSRLAELVDSIQSLFDETASSMTWYCNARQAAEGQRGPRPEVASDK